MRVRDIYAQLPPTLQTAAVSLEGARLVSQRMGFSYWVHKRRLPEFYAMPRPELEQYQLRRLREIVAHARHASAYYRKALQHVEPGDLRTLEDVKRLPVLTKGILRTDAAQVFTIRERWAIVAHTGGSTGKPLEVRFRRSDVQERTAELDFFREQHGFREGQRRAAFTGRPVVPRSDKTGTFWRDNLARRQRLFSTWHINSETLDRYVDAIDEFRPAVLEGFTSALASIARHLLEKGRRPEAPVRAIFPTSEPLLHDSREMLRSAFGVEPRDQYASSEGAPFIVECGQGRLHYLMHTGIIEVQSGGEALVTSFTTFGTPLIRYAIGDRILLSDDECSCGMAHPVVERIEGRTLDYLESHERGRVYSGNLANVVKLLPRSVLGTQFVQEFSDRVTVRLLVDEEKFSFVRDVGIVKQEIRERLGDSIELDVQVVSELERLPSGKTPFVLQRIGSGEANTPT